MSNEKTNTPGQTDDHTNQLEKIAKELDKARSGVSNEKVDLCAEYKIVKPILQKALPFIRLIPKFGSQVAGAIELLMGIADNFCPKS